MNAEEYIGTSHAASLLGVERRTLLRMEEHGVLKAFRPYPQAHRRWRLSDIESFMNGDDAA